MARDLAHTEGSEKMEVSGGLPADEGEKQLLNRREYVAAGAVAVTTAFGSSLVGGVSAGEEDQQSFATDFSEYAL